VRIQGLIVDDPEPAGAFTRFRLRAEAIASDDTLAPATAYVQVTLRPSADLVAARDEPYLRYGDRVLLEGTLEAPSSDGEFNYAGYLDRQGIHSVMLFPTVQLVDEGQGAAFYQRLYRLRYTLAESLARAVPEPQAAFGQAILLGLRDNLSSELKDDFQTTGASHVLAISGLHVGVLLAVTMTASAQAFGRRNVTYLLMPLTLIWIYAVLSGASPSAVRAAIMGSAYIAAMLLGRPSSVLPSVSVAAMLMVAVSPNVIESVSFQLSFAAMAGIAVFADPISTMLARATGVDHTASSWRGAAIFGIETTAATMAATFATLPLIAFYFEYVSAIGILSTLLVLPAMPVLMVAHLLTAAIGPVFAPAAQVTGWLAWLASAYVTGVVRLLALFPASSFTIENVPGVALSAYYGAMGCAAYAVLRVQTVTRWLNSMRSGGRSPIQEPSRMLWYWGALPVLGVATLVLVAASSQPDGLLHVAFVDIGQGDGAFIQTPDGQQVLIDGGPDPLDMVRFLGNRMPFQDRKIELVVLTHGHADHVTGLIEVLRRYDVERILERKVDYDSPQYAEWRKAVSEEGAEVIEARAGQVIAFPGGAYMQVVNPQERLLTGTASDVDNASVALRLVYGENSFLLTGDMFAEAERALISSGADIDSDVLKVGHHGSRSSTTVAFLEAVSPSVAVISAGQDSRFGHPHAETIEALSRYIPESLLFVTGDQGTIEFTTDGQTLHVQPSR
jgi:competence protein ComEC